MSTKKDKLIEVNGLVIKTNSIYKITNKLDTTAPDGFQREGTTKLPSSGIGNTVPCRYVITNKSKGTGVFDTGLYAASPMYSTLPKDEVEATVRKLREAILEPYENKYEDGILSHKNEEFWTEFGVNLFEGRYFITSNPEDLLELYIAMVGFELTPKEQMGNPKFRDSDYCIEDKEKVKNIQSERAIAMIDSITNFGTLLKTDRTKLLNILRYVRLLGIGDEIDDDTLNGLFFEWLNKSSENPKIFKTTYTMAKDKKTQDIVNIYAIVSRLAAKNVITRVHGMYVYKGKELGLDLKTVAKNVNAKKELQEIKIEFIEAD